MPKNISRLKPVDTLSDKQINSSEWDKVEELPCWQHGGHPARDAFVS